MLSTLQKYTVQVVLLLTAQLLPSSVSAEPTRYQFSVTLDSVINTSGLLDGSVQPGSEATGYFTFDPVCADTINVTGDSKFYVLSPVNGLTLNLGDHVHTSQGEVNLQIAKYSSYDAFTFDFNGPYWLTQYREYLDFWGPKDQCFVNTEVTDPGFPGNFACYTVIHNMLVVTPDFEVFGRWHSMSAVDPCSYDTDSDGIVDCLDPDDNANNINDACDIAYHRCSPDIDLDGIVDGSGCDTEIGPHIAVLYDQSKAHKSGSTVPIKVQLVDANGSNISSSQTALHAINVVQVSSQASTTLDDSGSANPDFDFRYDGTLGGYIYNLKTTGYGTGSYRLNFVAGESPVVFSVGFQIRQ